MENNNLKQEGQCAINDVIHSVCPNCDIEMNKITIKDEHKSAFDKHIMAIDVRFQYHCPKCEHLSFKHCV